MENPDKIKVLKVSLLYIFMGHIVILAIILLNMLIKGPSGVTELFKETSTAILIISSSVGVLYSLSIDMNSSFKLEIVSVPFVISFILTIVVATLEISETKTLHAYTVATIIFILAAICLYYQFKENYSKHLSIIKKEDAEKRIKELEESLGEEGLEKLKIRSKKMEQESILVNEVNSQGKNIKL